MTYEEIVQAAAEALCNASHPVLSWRPCPPCRREAKEMLHAALAKLQPVAYLHDSTKTLYDYKHPDCDLCQPLYLIPQPERQP